jgi:hypothetical protein
MFLSDIFLLAFDLNRKILPYIGGLFKLKKREYPVKLTRPDGKNGVGAVCLPASIHKIKNRLC